MTSYGTSFAKEKFDTEDCDDQQTRKSALRRVGGALIIFFAIAAVVGVWWNGSSSNETSSILLDNEKQNHGSKGNQGHISHLKPSASEAIISSGKLSIQADNEYTLRGDKRIEDYPWEIVEPYRDTFLTVNGGAQDSTFVWTISREEDYRGDAYMETLTDPVITTEFKTPGKYNVLVQEMRNGIIVDFTEQPYVAKYVRREIRSLTEEDRERFFDSVETLMNVPTDIGKESFGDDYYDKDWFIREHMYGGALIDCDHWHAGTGFFATHVAFTLQWEKAIQAVDPRVAAHYWDFTIETEALGYKWRESSLFSPNWFGRARSETGVLSEGRWAYTPVLSEADSFSSVTNSWNLLRSPWNNDPRPYLTRFDTLFNYADHNTPKGCAEYYGCLQTTNWMDLAACMNGDAHGKIHQLIGGSWGGKYDTFLHSKLLEGTAWANQSLVIDSFLIETEAFIKLLWRNGNLLCPDSCPPETSEDDCQCYCDFSQDIWGETTPYELLDNLGILRKLYKLDSTGFVQSTTFGASNSSSTNGSHGTIYWLDGVSDDDANEIWIELINAICVPGYIGTMYEGESPNDITFWVLHPTMDRLWHWMRLSPYYYGFDDTWEDGAYGTCSGHYKHDIPGNFTNLFDDQNKLYTNSELYILLHPMNDNLQYVYDNFEWSHCVEKGYDFTNLIEDWRDSGISTGGQPYYYDSRP